MSQIQIVEGDLLEQETEAIVNAWNRNIIPWWLLIPSGVSGAIKRKAGVQPFVELATKGPMPLGSAAITGAGKLPYKCIIHVAAINMLWQASEESVRKSTLSAMSLAQQERLTSLAFPILGAGAGGMRPDEAEEIMLQTLRTINSDIRTVLVRYR